MLSTSQAGEGIRLAPWAHGSRREAFQPGTRVRPSVSLKRLSFGAPDAVRGAVAHGVKLLRSGRGRGGRRGVSAHSIEVPRL